MAINDKFSERMRKVHLYRLAIAGGLFLGAVAATEPVRAQIVPDGTVNSTVTPQGTTSTITGGTVKGGNLFHSFKEFSIPTGSEAHFNNATNIQNIFTRVTGSSPSNIDGIIRAEGTANLFFLNPNGIMFGPNAELKIGGSFLATTASSIRFAGGTQFSATDTQPNPLLTVNVPIGLQFGTAAQTIVNQSTAIGEDRDGNPITVGLSVPLGKTLALVGGNIELEGGYLTAPQGRIELGSVAGSSPVTLNRTGTGWSLGYEGVQNFQDIQVSQKAVVDASGERGGDIQVRGRQVTLRGESYIQSLTQGNQDGGEIFIGADQLHIEEFSLVDASTESSGRGGDITIETRQVFVRDGAQVVAGADEGTGAGGELKVNARESIELEGTSEDGYASGFSATTDSAGNAGNLTIKTERLILRDGAQVTASTTSAGNAGKLTVRASEVELIGISALQAQVEEGGTGAGGTVTVETGKLIVRDGGQVGAGTFSKGNGGSLSVTATDSIELIGTGISDLGKEIPSGLFARTENVGDAGKLTISTGRLIVRDGAVVTATTFAGGQKGSLTVNAGESIELIGTSAGEKTPSGLFAATVTSGQGGDLTITAGRLSVRDGAKIAVTGEKSGSAGNLEIAASSIQLESGGSLTAESEAGEGGNMALRPQNFLILTGSSQITATAGTAQAGGNGGNITLNTNVVAAKENSDITANAYEGNGGNIEINTRGIFGIQFREQESQRTSDITASSEFGLAGVVEINTPDTDPTSGLVAPPELLDVTGLIAQGCPADKQNNFTITGRGGLPPTPQEELRSEDLVADLGNLAQRGSSVGKPAPAFVGHLREGLSAPPTDCSNGTCPVPTSVTAPLVEATGWVTGPNGQVILTASAPAVTGPTVTPHSPWLPPATSCTPR